MDELMARTIVETLSQGVDPLTGYPLPKSDLCSNKEIQDALNTVLANCTIESTEQMVKRLRKEKREKASKPRFENQGAPWMKEDEETLIALNSCRNVWQIANIMQRSPGAIISKLHHLGVLPNKTRR